MLKTPSRAVTLIPLVFRLALFCSGLSAQIRASMMKNRA